MLSQESSRGPLSPGEKLLEWLYEQQRNGKGTVTFLEQDEGQDERLKELNMSLREVKSVAEDLCAWGREHCEDAERKHRGIPPVCVDDVAGGFALSIHPWIGGMRGAYKTWLQRCQRG